MSFVAANTQADQRTALFSAQTAKARQLRLQKLARGDSSIRDLLEERNALTVAHADLRKKHVDAQARIAELESQLADALARIESAKAQESPPKRHG